MFTAMEHGPFEDVFPIENGGSIAMLVYQRVPLYFLCCKLFILLGTSKADLLNLRIFLLGF